MKSITTIAIKVKYETEWKVPNATLHLELLKLHQRFLFACFCRALQPITQCWVHECNSQSEAFRLVTSDEEIQFSRALTLTLLRILSSQTKKVTIYVIVSLRRVDRSFGRFCECAELKSLTASEMGNVLCSLFTLSLNNLLFFMALR